MPLYNCNIYSQLWLFISQVHSDRYNSKHSASLISKNLLFLINVFTFHNCVYMNLLCQSLCLSSEHTSPKAERPGHWGSCWATGPQHLWRAPSLDPHERWVVEPSLSTQSSAAEHLTMDRTFTLNLINQLGLAFFTNDAITCNGLIHNCSLVWGQ